MLTGTCGWAAAEPKGTYTLTFADGATETAVLDAEHGLMTIGEVGYQKYPSGYSGKAAWRPVMVYEVTKLVMLGKKCGAEFSDVELTPCFF